MRMTKIVEIWSCSCNIPKSSCKSHVVVNGLVTFWLISTTVDSPKSLHSQSLSYYNFFYLFIVRTPSNPHFSDLVYYFGDMIIGSQAP